MPKILSLALILPLLLVNFMVLAEALPVATDLFDQIQAFQKQNKIEMVGLEKIENTHKILLSGGVEQNARQLFSDYNHIISRAKNGKIERIVIVGKIVKSDDTRLVLPTRRQGNHFIVSVDMSGDGRIWQSIDMVIDTGADLVVLPYSMIDTLGIDKRSFAINKMQTANGEIDAKVGQLKELKIAGESMENVAVAFIPDQLLGGNRLLGMSVLGKYQVNIDDNAQIITLIRK